MLLSKHYKVSCLVAKMTKITSGAAMCLLCACTPKQQQSQVDNSNIQDLMEFGSTIGHHFIQRNSSDALIFESAVLPWAFVTLDEAARSLQTKESLEKVESWKSDAAWLEIASSTLSTLKPPLTEVTCSSWFDAFLRGEQGTKKEKDAAGHGQGANQMLQFRACKGPKIDAGNSIFNRLAQFIKTCGGVLSKETNHRWKIYRAIPVSSHALVTSLAERQMCSPWTAELSFVNLMGRNVNYSHHRQCTIKCPSKDLDGTEAHSICARLAPEPFREYAEFPTPELVARTTPQSGASCPTFLEPR
jgi:hypothetical protein